jgi:hypothetical protein
MYCFKWTYFWGNPVVAQPCSFTPLFTTPLGVSFYDASKERKKKSQFAEKKQELPYLSTELYPAASRISHGHLVAIIDRGWKRSRGG